MWFGVIQIGLVMAFATLLTMDLLLPGGWFAGEQSIETSRSAAFTVLVLAQLFNAFNAALSQPAHFEDCLIIAGYGLRSSWGCLASGCCRVATVRMWPSTPFR